MGNDIGLWRASIDKPESKADNNNCCNERQNCKKQYSENFFVFIIFVLLIIFHYFILWTSIFKVYISFYLFCCPFARHKVA